MVRSPRLALLLVAPLLALGAASCGIEAGEQGEALVVSDTTAAPDGPAPAPSTTEPGDDPGEQPDTSIPGDIDAQLFELYTDMGFTDEEASCLADEIIASGGDIDSSDPGAVIDVMNQCDISMGRLMELTDELGGGDPEAAMRESLAAGFRASGMTDEQAECAADGFIEEFGTDTSAAADPDNLIDIFGACGVDPSTIGG